MVINGYLLSVRRATRLIIHRRDAHSSPWQRQSGEFGMNVNRTACAHCRQARKRGDSADEQPGLLHTLDDV